MKRFYTALLCIALLPLGAQVADKSVTDCAGTTKSIHGILGSGKVLVVASKGLDCSICKNSAPDVQNFAAQNVGTIEVWGAMTFTYSSNTPSCSQVDNWVNTYNWSDVFAFVDSDRHWFKTGTPRYLVYDPSDFSIAYTGASRSTAFQTAINLANSVGIEAWSIQDIEIVNIPGGMDINNLSDGAFFSLYSLTGKVVKEGVVDSNNKHISTQDFNSGIYLLMLQTEAGTKTVRKIFVN